MAASATAHLALHLADRALTPIISSSRQPSSSSAQTRIQAQALSSLTTTAISAYDAASRLGLGLPVRIMIETQSSGPIVLHSYLNPQQMQRPRSRRTQSREIGDGVAEQTRAELRPLSGPIGKGNSEDMGQRQDALVNGVLDGDRDGVEDADNMIPQPPLLIATVVASTAVESGEARRAAARLERTARTFQREWTREQEESRQLIAVADEEDG